jgi:cation transport ATPase
MDEKQNNEPPVMSPVEDQEFDIGHSDKIVGLFTEPGKTFGKMSKYPPKTVDWLIPILILIVVTILSQIVMMSNPVIKHELTEKNMAKFEKQFKQMVEKGQISQTQADEQLDTMRERMEKGGIIQLIGTIVGIPIIMFIFFFIVSGILLIIAKYILGGEGTYRGAMAAYGLPHYVMSLQVIVLVIAALVMNKYLTGISAADLMSSDKSTFIGFVLGKLDIFSIWFYILVGIGLAKMFSATNTSKYIFASLGMWIGFALLFFLLAKVLPFLNWFMPA